MNHDYDCRECGKPVLYRSDHAPGCSYGKPPENKAALN